jgi:hypothetical protein
MPNRSQPVLIKPNLALHNLTKYNLYLSILSYLVSTCPILF